jgi:putative NAD(P)-binding protein
MDSRIISRLRPGDRLLVCGAGPAGLTAAYLLAKDGFEVTVLETDDQVGCLSRTVPYKNFRFDISGHRFFTKSSEVQVIRVKIALMNSTEDVLSTFSGKLSARAWGVAVGLLFGRGLFIATNILVLKGGPTVGRHLGLLGAFLPGYRGQPDGLGYGVGWTIGRVYNGLARMPR